MNNKRLHIHSLPVLLFVLSATIVTIISVNVQQMSPITEALARPALRFEATDHGFVKVTVNRTIPDEPAGVEVDGLSQSPSVMRATQAAGSVGMQLVLDKAAE